MVATLVKTKDTCDVCNSTRRRTQRYRVGLDGDLVKVDLCKEDGAYLDKLIKLGERTPNPSPRVKVWTMEEIEREGRRKNRP